MSFSETAARNTLRRFNTTPEEVRKLTGLPPPKPAPKSNTGRPKLRELDVQPPKTLEERRNAAKMAAHWYESSFATTFNRSLQRVGLPCVYIAGLRECVNGDGPITRAVRAGDLSKLTPQERQTAVFIRWFYDINLK